MLAQAQRRDRHRHPFHITRAFPKRAEELLAGGSLYWVFGGFIRARQLILALEPVQDEMGVRRCKIIFDNKLHLTQSWPRRPFRGWRYLDNPPPDLNI